MDKSMEMSLVERKVEVDMKGELKDVDEDEVKGYVGVRLRVCFRLR